MRRYALGIMRETPGSRASTRVNAKPASRLNAADARPLDGLHALIRTAGADSTGGGASAPDRRGEAAQDDVICVFVITQYSLLFQVALSETGSYDGQEANLT